MDDYRTYVQVWARARKRGEFRKIARALGIHSTLLSQILSGRKRFTEEQGSRLCSYMGLNQLETDYLLKLIQIERAGTENLKTIYRRHLNELLREATEIKSRVPAAKEMTLADRAIFYSSWQYSLIRLLTSIERYETAEAIAKRLDLSVSRVQEILEFMTSRGLCHEIRGKFRRTLKNTHIEASSPLAARHHLNWRLKSCTRLENLSEDELAFTAPISIALTDFREVRKILLDAITQISKVVDASPADEVAYLGIDWQLI